jgi:DNA polymerase-3 subunit epsilon
MDFVAFDVETANADLASICQIGMVTFQDGQIKETWGTLVDPEDEFDGMNISIHGIDEDAVIGAPKFPDLFESFKNRIDGKVVVSHMAFDRVAVEQITEKYGLPKIECTWLDSARVVRRAWPDEFAQRGYGLANVAKWCGIEFNHHRADEDARVAGEILLRAIADTGLNVDEWLKRVKRPIAGSSQSGKITREGNPEGPLAGEVIVFTAGLAMPRSQAADLAAQAGCDVGGSDTKQTTILVVGGEDVRRLDGRKKSSKHQKAEGLISKGQEIRIIGKGDFLRMIET